MHELAPLIYDLAIMLGVAAIVVIIFQRIHQPVILGYLVAGIIIGPHTPPHTLITDIPDIKILSELGVIFLMFSLGLEFSFNKLMRVGIPALITGIIDVTVMAFVGYHIGRMIGWTYHNSLFLGFALCVSSTTIIIKTIDELGLKNKRFSEIVFAILVIEDLLAILILVAIPMLTNNHSVFQNICFATLKLMLVIGSLFLIGYFFIPSLLRQIVSYVSQETLTIISVALCLFLVTIAVHYQYSAALGAFIMGSILAESYLVHRIENIIQPIRDIFGAIFFISVGMLINPYVLHDHWKIIIFISGLTIVSKAFVTSVGALITGQSINTSIRVGFSMVQIGEFSFIIATLGLALNLVESDFYPTIVAVSALTIFATPYLIRFTPYFNQFLSDIIPEKIHYFLRCYSSWTYRIFHSHTYPQALSRILIRLISNGILVAIIFMLVQAHVYPQLETYPIKSWIVNLLSLFTALSLSLPFIWGMLFSYKGCSVSPMMTRTSISLLGVITITEVIFLSLVYFYSWLTFICSLLTILFFFIFSYRYIEKSYYWFESNLVNNIKKENHLIYDDLAPWDTHLIEIPVSPDSHLTNKSLGESQVRRKFGINVVAIYRYGVILAAPRGDEKILPYDKLIILGNDDEIETFKNHVEHLEDKHEELLLRDKFSLKSFKLNKEFPCIGRSIRSSQLREIINGLVVGIESDHRRILNPDPNIILHHNDILLIVGERKRMHKLKKLK